MEEICNVLTLGIYEENVGNQNGYYINRKVERIILGTGEFATS